MTAADTAPTLAAGTDPRTRLTAAKRRDLWRWTLVGTGLLALLSFFTEGFFLYVALVVLGLYGLAMTVASVSLLGLEVERTLDRDEIELGEAVEARLVLHNRKELGVGWLLWRDQVAEGLDLEGAASGFRHLASGELRQLSYRLHSTRRGLFRVGPVVVESSGPFGLVRRFRVDSKALFVTVFPKTVAIGQGWPLGRHPIHQVPRRKSLFEDPTRFLGIRDYRHGDELRRVHWRATARSGKLQVKLYEPAVLSGALLAVEMGLDAYPRYDATAEGGDPRVELTVTAAASLAEFVLAGDSKVALLANGNDAAESFPEDWTGGSFRRLEEAMEEAGRRRRITAFRPLEVEAGKGGRQLERLRTALARLVPAPGLSLGEMLHVELPRLPRSLVVILVTPTLDEVLAAAVQALCRSGFELAVVWVGATLDAGTSEAALLPEAVPLYAIGGESDLEQLGGRPL
jgi:uncharacterized protein (DUF58 family)